MYAEIKVLLSVTHSSSVVAVSVFSNSTDLKPQLKVHYVGFWALLGKKWPVVFIGMLV